MDQSAMVENVPELVIGQDTVTVKENDVADSFSDNWADMGNELAKIAVETGAPKAEAQPAPEPVAETPTIPEAVPVVPEPAQPSASTQPAPTAPVTQEQPKPSVPDKFKDVNGALDQAKVLKAYDDAVKEMHRVKQQSHAPSVPVAPAPLPQPTHAPSPLEVQVAQRLASRGLDPQVANIIGGEMAELSRMAYESARQDALAEVQQIKQAQVDRQQSEELQAIAQRDPWVFTPEGVQTLTEIRQSREGITSWRQAYREHLADRAMSQIQQPQTPNPQVNTPTPKAVTAPSAPVTAAARGNTTTVKLDTPEAVTAYLERSRNLMTPEKYDKFEAEFWAKNGFKKW